MIDTLKVAGLILLFVGVIYALVRYIYRRDKAERESLASALGVSEIRPGVSYEGIHSGQSYRFKFIKGGKVPDSFSVSFDCKSNGEFYITRESDTDVYYKKIGISTEIQTGDLAFDEACYIQTDSIEFTKRFFQSAEKRKAALRLLELGFDVVSHKGETIDAVKNPLVIAKDSDTLALEPAVAELAVLARNPPDVYSETPAIQNRAWKSKTRSFVSLSLFLLIGGAILVIIAPQMFRPLERSVVFYESFFYSVPAFVFFVIASILVLKGHSSSHREIKANFFFALIGFPIFGYGALVMLNGILDEAEPSVHRVEVIDKYVTTSRNSDSHYVYVKSWRAGRNRESIRVTTNNYKSSHIGKNVQVITSPGKLGYEWIVDYKVTE